MGNYLGIATTTAVFAQKISQAMNKVSNLSAAPIVYTKRPEKPDGQVVGAYLYLYKVTHNHNLRNNDLATRRADGSLIRQPQVALNLSYHISFYGQDSELEAQRLMGATITDLHAFPLITPKEVKDYLNAVGPHSYLAESNLYDQDAAIKIEPVILSLEDISKMWTVFFQVPHEHSLNYEVSVLFMESDLNIQKSLPVKGISSYQDPNKIAAIKSITPPYLEYPVNSQKFLELECEGLNGKTKIEFNESPESVTPTIKSPNEAKVLIPATVRAGLNSVSMVKPLQGASGTTTSRSAESNFIIQPVISDVHYQQITSPINDQTVPVITLNVQPEIQGDQRLILWLNSTPDSSVPSYHSFKELLRFKVNAEVSDLQQGNISIDARESFYQKGITLSSAAKLTTIEANLKWTLEDGNIIYSLRAVGDDVICYYGFSSLSDSNNVSFELTGTVEGSFLVRVQVDNLQFAESVLISGPDPQNPSREIYTGPRVDIS